MTKQGSTSKTRLTGLLQRFFRTLGVRKNPRRAGRLPATGDDRSRQYAHEKPTKTENVVGAPKPSLPPLELHVSTAVVPDVDGVKLDRSRVLVTRIARAAKPGTVSLADFTEAQQLVEALPFEVLS